MWWGGTCPLQVSHCTALLYTALHCTTLYCIAPYCTVMHSTALHRTVQYWTALHCTALHCTIALNFSTHHCTRLCFTALQSILLYFTRLNNTLHFTPLKSVLTCNTCENSASLASLKLFCQLCTGQMCPTFIL